MVSASQSRLTTATASAAACYELIAGALVGCWVRRVEVYLVTAVASSFGLGRPAAKGVGATTPVGFRWTESADPTPSVITAASALAWGTTAPTVPTAFYRQVTMPATISASVVWTFPKLFVPAGASLVLWNIAAGANGTAYVNVDIEE